MRKALIILTTLIAIVGCQTRIKPLTDLDDNQLHGKVKQMLELTYYYGNVDRVFFEEKTKASDSMLYMTRTNRHPEKYTLLARLTK